MSSLRRGHANLLCIVPILADDLFRGSSLMPCPRFSRGSCSGRRRLWTGQRLNKNKKIKKNQTKTKTLSCAAVGAVRESNPRPLAPEARIIPLDQRPAASIEDRTRDLLLTRQMLCQLSYRGGRRACRGVTNASKRAPKTKRGNKKCKSTPGPWGN